MDEWPPDDAIVATNDLQLWRGGARQFAILKDKRFIVLGNWEQVEKASDEMVRELRTGAPQDQ